MKPNFKRFLAFVLVMVMVCAYIPTGAFAAEGEAPAQPTATVTEIKKDDLTFAMNFLADEVTDEQLAYYGDWYADFELTVNKKVTFNANGGADGYLSGQYDEWSENWVNVPFENVTLEADKPLKIMEYASELIGKTGLKYTYGEVYNAVKDFDCGVYFEPAFLKANPDLVVTLELKMYNPDDKTEGYVIGETYIFDTTEIFVAQNVQTGKNYNNVVTALEEAASGETVQLLNRAKAQIVTVLENTTLDLNGFELDADYMVSFGNIIDGSAANTGRLNVDAKRFLTQKENAQLPVNTDAGYLFVDVTKFNKAYLADTNRFVFQPFVEAVAHSALKAGKEASGVSVEVEISWKNAADNGTRSQNFVFNDDAVQTYLNSYNADTGKYGKTFMLTLTGAENLQDLQFRVVLRSKTDVAFYSDSVKVTVPEKPEESDKIVETTEEKELTTDDNTGNTALVPEGTKVEEGTALTLTVTEMTEGESNIEVGEGESKKSVDIHVTGVAADNEKPILVTLPAFAEKGLNEGNLKLYHVENGVTNEMTQVASVAEVDAHNEFFYDPATGDVTMALKSFSEVAMVAEDEKAWKGGFDYSWYIGKSSPYEIFNADQLAAFGAIVDGTAEGIEQDSFSGKTIMLCNDINLGGEAGGYSFNPIGYGYESSGGQVFKGTFDGNGCTISNLYQNGWAMGLSYSTAGGGLFASAVDATFKNLTLDHAYVVMECIDMGTLVGYAYGECHFENIFVSNSVIANYNRYTGGVVGEVGGGVDSEDEDTYSHTFVNVDVDANTTISALWGTFDPGVGGIIGGKYGTATVYMKGCDVACELDVFNDVTSAYRWYSYRRCGMLIGHIEDATRTLNGRTEAYADFLTTEDCTVTYGDWVHYHYCEFSHENYPYVRMEPGLFNAACSNPRYGLPKINAAGDKLTVTDPATGAHDSGHASGEDHAIEIVFNQLYGGGQGVYGGNWHADKNNPDRGVTIYRMEDSESVYPEAPDTVEKFKAKFENGAVIAPGTYTLAQLFDAVVAEDEIQNFYVYVSVTPVGENNPARGTFTKVDNDDWTQSTIAFSGEGELRITISDYYFCELTTINVTVGEQKPVEVQKFTAKDVTAQDAYTQLSLGDLFTTKDDVTIGDVTATVTDPNGNVTTVNGTSTNWKDQTIVLTKNGTWTVAIKDDDANANGAEVTFTVNKADKFDNKFDKNFLYRVGNQNAVGIGYIFGEKETAVKLSSVNVTVENVAGNVAAENLTGTTLTDGKLSFTGTGVVNVTISAEGANDLSLNLEVVDAVNATTATSATANNVVLLKDAGFGSLEVSGGYTLFGNGFTLTCGSDSAALDMSYSFVKLDNGTLDNVQIVCPDFSHAILYESNKTEGNEVQTTDRTRYYNIKSAVKATGKSQILNSYISGGRAAVYAVDGTLLIDNSTIEGGAAANIHTGACALTLRDVTLIQEPKAATVHTPGEMLMGLSVVVMCDGDGKCAPITLEGTLNQYAWAHEGYTKYVPEKGQSLISTVLKKNDYLHDITYADGTTADSLNLGFLFMPSGSVAPKEPVSNGMVIDNRTNKETVSYGAVDVNGLAYVYSYKNSNGTSVDTAVKPGYSPNEQDISLPTVTFTDANDARIFETTFDETTGNWVSTLKVDVDQGNYSFSFANLVAQKYGINLTYTVATAEGTAVDKNAAITLNDSVTKEYVLTITDNQIYDQNGIKIENASVIRTHVFKILATKTSLPAPEWVSTTLNGTPYIVVDSKDGDWNCAVPVLDGMKVKYYSTKAKAQVELDLSSITIDNGLRNGNNNSITIPGDDYTLTITSSGFKTNDNGKPVGVNGKLYFTVASSSNYVSTKTTDRGPSFTYTFTDANNSDPITTTQSMTVVYATHKNKQYKYSDFCNGKLTEASSGGCFTPDTLITLADGTQKEIQYVTYEDELLVWNFHNGQFTTAPAAIIFNHGDGLYRVLKLKFSDGSTFNVIQDHYLFDKGLNEFIKIDEFNVEDYLGHEFIKAEGDFTTVTLVDYEVEEQDTTAYSLLSAVHYNCIAGDLLTLSPNPYGGNMFMPFEVGAGMKFDAEKMQKDIETYGLFTYEEFAAYATPEQFYGLNGPQIKVAVGKGIITMEQLYQIIAAFLPDNDQ